MSAGVESWLAALRRAVAEAVARRRADDPTAGDAFRGLYVDDARAERLVAGGREPAAPDTPLAADVADDHGPTTRLAGLGAAAGLDATDLAMLVVAAGPDLDAGFEQLYGYLHDDVSRRRASVGLALELAGSSVLDGAARARLGPHGALVRCGLVEVEERERPALTRSLRVPDRVLAHLLGGDALPPELAAAGLAVPGGDVAEEGATDLEAADRSELAAVLRAGARLVHLVDPADVGADHALAVLRSLGRAALAVDLAAVASDAVAAAAGALAREGLLRGVAVIAVGLDRHESERTRIVAALRAAPLAITVSRRPFAASPSEAVSPVLPVPPLATELHPELAVRVAPTMARRVRELAAMHAPAGIEPDAAALADALRRLGATGLERSARRVRPRAGWGDFVAPSAVGDLVRELVLRVRHRDTVVDRWGVGGRGARGPGVTGLLAGPSGTGKTLAAEVVAGELSVDLFVVDLATVVDKYVGETEKHLERIFDEAERVQGVLLFDEADALFGKRSDVGSSHDRYANIEVAYLLQRMERFGGVALLTTNLRANIDDAFLRRIDVLVDMPLPDAPARLQLWKLHLPDRLPRSDDVDLEFLADSFELAGGSIRNIAVTAAFLAADEGAPLGMAHLVRASEREYRKLGRLCHPSEFGPYHHLLDQRGATRA